MRAVVQRVSEAAVRIDGDTAGAIGHGVLVLLGIETDDVESDTRYIADKVATLRIFNDDAGKFNRSLADVGGAILAVSQFTLLGDARRGRRPSFISAARPEQAIPLYEGAIAQWRGMGFQVETGRFGANMAVSLINDGPVTILLDSKKAF